MSEQSEVEKRLVQYFKAGEKDAGQNFEIGIELEHFIVEKESKKAVSYYGEFGVENILKKLKKIYAADEIYAKEYLIGLQTKEFILTLEPAGQLEISINPQNSLCYVEKIYKEFRTNLQRILDVHGYYVLQYGYQPKSQVVDLELLPKVRYQMMDRYFTKIGSYGQQMMRGTASTQVCIDFTSEKDFKKKYVLAYQLAPIMMFLFDNSPFYEGKKNTIPMLRNRIWNGVDEKRVNVWKQMDFSDISYDSYASFVADTPIIVLETKKDILYSCKSVRECYTVPSEAEVEHILSMVFPMVRLKQFIEIRYADAMEIDLAMFYITWIKGLFVGVDEVERYLKGLECGSVSNMEEAFEKLAEKKEYAVVYGEKLNKIVRKLYEIGNKYVSEKERNYLSINYMPENMKRM